jgi:DNA-binding NarL/FixJ family response regulator
MTHPARRSIRVLLADDQQLVRTGFRMILRAEPDIEIVGEAADGAQAVDAVRRLSPDVVVMDVRMPIMDGLEATRRITAFPPGGPRVLILTTFDLDEYVYEALRAGAAGFLLKDGPAEQLVGAIRALNRGGALLAPTVTRRLIAEFARRPPPGEGPPPELAALTARELDVLRQLARGMSNTEIAIQLTVGDATIKTHVARILGKLGLRDRTQAVVYAYETGLVQAGDRYDAPGEH